MLSGHRSARRRHGRNSHAARIVVPVAIPMALGLTLGVIVAVSGGQTTTIGQSAATQAAVGPSGSPSTSADSPANVAVSGAPSFAGGPTAFGPLGDLATDPVDGTGAPINLNQTAVQAAATLNCTLIVPSHPLSARGLATPYQLGDGCSEQDYDVEGAFVEATILSPDGSLQVYNPLVITEGTQPAVRPAVPRIAPGSHVIIDIGFNGTNLVLEGRGAWQGNCVDALGQSVIGQVSACNAVSFYRAANAQIADGTLQVPRLGTSEDGQPCLTTRDFAVVDQDPSDNVITTYLLTTSGQIAQNTAANAASLRGAQTIGNGSDDKLLANFLDPAEGCRPFIAPDATDPGGFSGSQALNELSARVNQRGIIALVPTDDEMTLVNKQYSIAKTNVYRSLVDQPLLVPGTNAAQVAEAFCQNMVNIAPARDELDTANELHVSSPVPAVGDNLATFMGARLAASFGNLGCGNFGLTNPVTVTTDGPMAVQVAYNTSQELAAFH